MTSRWRVVNAEPANYADEARRLLETVADVHEAALDRPALLAAVGSADALIVRLRHQIDDEVFEAGAAAEGDRVGDDGA